MPQRDLISSSWAVDPGSRQTYTGASEAYGKGDLSALQDRKGINNHLYTAAGDIKDVGVFFAESLISAKSRLTIWSESMTCDYNIKPPYKNK